MTANSPNPRPQLIVVPPTVKPSDKLTPPPLVVPSPSAPPGQHPIQTPVSEHPAQAPVSPAKSNPLSKFIPAGVVLVGLGCISLIPVPHAVSGDAEITSTQNARQTVIAKVNGIVREIYFNPGETVKRGQIVAMMESQDLENNIAQVTIEADRTWASADSAKQQLTTVDAKVNQALVNEATSRQQVEQVYRKLAKINQLPQIAEIESYKQGLQADIDGLKRKISRAEEKLIAHQSLFNQGAISTQKLREVENERDDLLREMKTKESQMQAKSAQAAQIAQSLRDELGQRQGELQRMEAARISATKEAQTIVATAQTQLNLANKIEKEVKRRQNQQQQLLPLRAETDGIVIADKLDLIKNQPLKTGEKLLDIVDLGQLTVSVKIPQEEADLINQPNFPVKFCPRGSENQCYRATLQKKDVSFVMESSETQPHPSLTVKILIHGSQELLRPGVKGSAHIETGSMPLYKKIQREFLKLVQPGRWGIG